MSQQIHVPLNPNNDPTTQTMDASRISSDNAVLKTANRQMMKLIKSRNLFNLVHETTHRPQTVVERLQNKLRARQSRV